MKRIIIMLLVFSMMIGLCGCGKSQAVKDTEAAIQEIGNVTSDSGRKITAAENLFNDLKDKEKNKVKNADVLEYSRNVYDAIQNGYYYDAICLFAEHNDLDGVKYILNNCEHGDKAVLVAICDNNMVVTFSTGMMPAGVTISGGDNWIFTYTFPMRGLPQRFGLMSEKYNDIKDFSETVENMITKYAWADEVLYSFDIS